MNRCIFRTFAVSLGLTLVAAGPALAGPVCLHDSVSAYYFAKLKLPKKPGQTTTFSGVRALGFARNATGTASMGAGGQISVTLRVEGTSNSGNDFTVGWVAADSTLAGTGSYDNDGDYQRDDGTLAMSLVDCDTVTIP